MGKMKLICVRNKKTGSYLNYARKHKKWFSEGTIYRTSNSPYPSLRYDDELKRLKEWISNTPNPDDYEIIEFKEKGVLR